MTNLMLKFKRMPYAEFGAIAEQVSRSLCEGGRPKIGFFCFRIRSLGDFARPPRGLLSLFFCNKARLLLEYKFGYLGRRARRGKMDDREFSYAEMVAIVRCQSYIRGHNARKLLKFIST
jgi:hypothetical protein